MKILIIDNNDSFTYNLVQLVGQSGCTDFRVIKNNISGFDAGGFDKIIFSPGPGIPDEEAGLMKYIMQNYASAKSILGICLGHQAIAGFFGAKLINLPEVFHGVKEKIIVAGKGEYLFKGIAATFYGGLYHSWCVSDNCFPDCLEISAVSESGIIMALSHKIYDVKGVQFHPESIMTDYGSEIIRNWMKKNDK